jgi:OOP family OmpA-OmpF porin
LFGAKYQTVEGEFHFLDYGLPATASKAQVARNMNAALKTAGYTIIYENGNHDKFVAHMGKTWIQIEMGNGAEYWETVVVETTLTQDVVANAAELSTGISASGHIVVNGILFDTAKADVKPESSPAIEQVAKMLAQDPKLKVYVVGHTDNVGALASNLDLSKRRAAAVVQMLITQYHVAADRLAPYGDGPYAPIQTNDTEAGRALNRRVELVKQ